MSFLHRFFLFLADLLAKKTMRKVHLQISTEESKSAEPTFKKSISSFEGYESAVDDHKSMKEKYEKSDKKIIQDTYTKSNKEENALLLQPEEKNYETAMEEQVAKDQKAMLEDEAKTQSLEKKKEDRDRSEEAKPIKQIKPGDEIQQKETEFETLQKVTEANQLKAKKKKPLVEGKIKKRLTKVVKPKVILNETVLIAKSDQLAKERQGIDKAPKDQKQAKIKDTVILKKDEKILQKDKEPGKTAQITKTEKTLKEIKKPTATISDEHADYFNVEALKLIHKKEKHRKDKSKPSSEPQKETDLVLGKDAELRDKRLIVLDRKPDLQKSQEKKKKSGKKSIKELKNFQEKKTDLELLKEAPALQEKEGDLLRDRETLEERKQLSKKSAIEAKGIEEKRKKLSRKNIDKKKAFAKKVGPKKKRLSKKQRKEIPSSLSSTDEELFADILAGLSELKEPKEFVAEDRVKYLEEMIQRRLFDAEKKLQEKRRKRKSVQGSFFDKKGDISESLLGGNALIESLQNAPKSAESRAKYLEKVLEHRLLDAERRLKEKYRKKKKGSVSDLAVLSSDEEVFARYLMALEKWEKGVLEAPASADNRAKHLEELILQRLVDGDHKLKKRIRTKAKLKSALSGDDDEVARNVLGEKKWRNGLRNAPSSAKEKAKYLEKLIQQRLRDGERIINNREQKAQLSKEPDAKPQHRSIGEEVAQMLLDENKWIEDLQNAPTSAAKRVKYLEDLIQRKLLDGEKILEANRNKKKAAKSKEEGDKKLSSSDEEEVAGSLLGQKEWMEGMQNAPVSSAEERAKYLEELIKNRLFDSNKKLQERKMRKKPALVDYSIFADSLLDKYEWLNGLKQAPALAEERVQHLQSLITARVRDAGQKLSRKKAQITNESPISKDDFDGLVETFLGKWKENLKNAPTTPEDRAKFLEDLIQNHLRDGDAKLEEGKKRLQDKIGSEVEGFSSDFEKFAETLIGKDDWLNGLENAPISPKDRAKFLENLINNQLLIANEKVNVRNTGQTPSFTDLEKFLEFILDRDKWIEGIKHAPTFPEERAKYLEILIKEWLLDSNKKLMNKRKKVQKEYPDLAVLSSDIHVFAESVLGRNEWKEGIENAPVSAEEKAKYLEDLVSGKLLTADEKMNERKRKIEYLISSSNELNEFAESLLGQNDWKKALENAPASPEKRARYLEDLIKERLQVANEKVRERKEKNINARTKTDFDEFVESLFEQNEWKEGLAEAPDSAEDRAKYLQDFIQNKLADADKKVEERNKSFSGVLDSDESRFIESLLGRDEWNKALTMAPLLPEDQVDYLENLIQTRLNEVDQKVRKRNEMLAEASHQGEDIFLESLLSKKDWKKGLENVPTSVEEKVQYLEDLIQNSLKNASEKINESKIKNEEAIAEAEDLFAEETAFVQAVLDRDKWRKDMENAPICARDRAEFIENLIKKGLDDADRKLNERNTIMKKIEEKNKFGFVKSFLGHDQWNEGLKKAPASPEKRASYLQTLIQDRMRDCLQKLKSIKSTKADAAGFTEKEDNFIQALLNRDNWEKSLEKAPTSTEKRSAYLEKLIQEHLLDAEQKLKTLRPSKTGQDIFFESLLEEDKWKEAVEKAPISAEERAHYFEDLINKQLLGASEKIKERKKETKKLSQASITDQDIFFYSIREKWMDALQNAPISEKERAKYLEEFIKRTLQDENRLTKERKQTKKEAKPVASEQGMFLESLLGRDEWIKGLKDAPASEEERAKHLENFIEQKLREGEQKLKNYTKMKKDELTKSPVKNEQDEFFESLLGRDEFMSGIKKAPKPAKEKAKHLEKLIEHQLQEAERKLAERLRAKRKAPSISRSFEQDELREETQKAPTSELESAKFLENIVEQKLPKAGKELVLEKKRDKGKTQKKRIPLATEQVFDSSTLRKNIQEGPVSGDENLIQQKLLKAEEKLEKKNKALQYESLKPDLKGEIQMTEKKTVSIEDRAKQLEELIEKRLRDAEIELAKKKKKRKKQGRPMTENDEDEFLKDKVGKNIKGMSLSDNEEMKQMEKMIEQRLDIARKEKEKATEKKIMDASKKPLVKKVYKKDHTEDYVVNLRQHYSWEQITHPPTMNPSRTAKRVSLHDNIASGSHHSSSQVLEHKRMF